MGMEEEQLMGTLKGPFLFQIFFFFLVHFLSIQISKRLRQPKVNQISKWAQ